MVTNQSMIGYIKDKVTDLNEKKLVYFNRSFTMQQVLTDVKCVGTFLKYNGVKKGDSVIICLPNFVQAVISFYAINSIGAIADIVHPKIGTEGLVNIIKETNTKWVFLYDKFYKEHGKALNNCGAKTIKCSATDYLFGEIKNKNHKPYILKESSVNYKKILVAPSEYNEDIKGEDTAVYLHSSGTTGKPKIVLLSNYAMNELVKNTYGAVKDNTYLPRTSGMLMTLPVFHGFGLGICMHLMMYLGNIVLQPVFNAKKTVKIMKSQEVNLLCLVPNMLRKLLVTKGFVGEHLKNIEKIFVGGDKLDENLRKKAQEVLLKSGSKGVICEGFGLSETASVTHINTDCKEGGTVGKPIPNVYVKIMDGDKELPPMQEGAVYISSNSIMTGYLNDNSKNLIITDENGRKWLDTGDIGYVDEEGFFYYKGRQKRMLKIGGVNIFPQEIEAVACSIPQVKNACAVRTTLDNKPIIKLLLVLQDGEKLTNSLKQKICDNIRSHILPYAVPRIIETVDSFVMTGMAKTDYRYYEEKENNKNK